MNKITGKKIDLEFVLNSMFLLENPVMAAHPASELFSLFHFPRVAINQEALGVAEACHHGLLQELQNDALQQRDRG